MGNLSVVGLQWGDEGKGKLVDYLADRFEAVARYNGGSNAGHTVVIGRKKHTFHLIPSGAFKAKSLLIGAGVVLDPIVLSEELRLLNKEGAKSRPVVDGRCTLVSPMERESDRLLEEMRGSTSIGTTGRGIGPAYAMRAFRLAPRVSDVLSGFDFGPMKRFYAALGIDGSKLESWAKEARRLLRGLVGDVSTRIEEINSGGGSVLYESSQGTLLDILHGSYPFVTSTHTVVSYIPASLGIPPSMAGEPLGVMKCYTTRVGAGPFPTEVSGKLGESIRRVGNEYGATTGRPRRVGWLDLVALRYAIRLNGVKKVALSKIDVLARIKEFKACVAYRRLGSESADFQKSLGHLAEVEPVLASPFSIRGAAFGRTLPSGARKLVDYVEAELGVDVKLVSFGEERSRTIEL
ncbi:MAG: adenylosuccinate synthetase [Nitrososphaerales archaeon]|nr:adenylosuccinate synthetase [Nitrososphaerales archaeon]